MRKLLSVFVISFLLSSNGVCGVLPGFRTVGEYEEQILTFSYPADVRIKVNAPAGKLLDPSKRTELILYALPNGNTTEQTEGKLLKAGDDWHFGIQHIAAQTRFLRRLMNEENIITVYLEAGGKSWPAWRKGHSRSSEIIVSIVDSVKNLFPGHPLDITLSGHSGGGSFIFGFLDGVTQIPDDIERISFLDADYAYEDSLHAAKLSRWLGEGHSHYLCVLAYDDSVALLNGKPFVTPTGGTWHRSHMMMETLNREFPFGCETRGELRKCDALKGRVQFLLMENPERAILHTLQVERNGFIQCISSGTMYEGMGYQYFGERAYDQYISEEKDSVALWRPSRQSTK